MTEVRNLRDAELRFGDWGPGYLVQGDDAMFGVVTLRPGDAFPNHRHDRHAESFLVLAGVAELWMDRAERLELREGDLVTAPAGVEHYLRNTGAVPFTAFFAKAPGVPGDKVDLEWQPEEGGT
jgi:quercetin dioxygenase-like cupin family protein